MNASASSATPSLNELCRDLLAAHTGMNFLQTRHLRLVDSRNGFLKQAETSLSQACGGIVLQVPSLEPLLSASAVEVAMEAGIRAAVQVQMRPETTSADIKRDLDIVRAVSPAKLAELATRVHELAPATPPGGEPPARLLRKAGTTIEFVSRDLRECGVLIDPDLALWAGVVAEPVSKAPERTSERETHRVLPPPGARSPETDFSGAPGWRRTPPPRSGGGRPAQ